MDNWRSYIPQVLAAVSASLAMLSTGLVRGWSSPALPLLADPAETNSTMLLDSTEVAWLAAIPPMCALVGCLVISIPMEYLGRRVSLIGIAVPFISGFYLMGISHYIQSKPLLFVGRVLTGFVNGASTPAAQIYITECCAPKIRGILGSLTANFLALGILVAYIIGAFVTWHSLCFILGSLPFLLIVCMAFMPETPYWLMAKGKHDRAKQTLQRLRGRNSESTTEELNELIRTVRTSTIEEKPTFSSHLNALRRKAILKPLFISMAAMFFQQFSGINAVVFYTVTIFRAAGSSVERNLATVIVGIVQLVGTVLAATLVDRYGRRLLLLVSGTFMALSLGSMGSYFYLKLQWGDEETTAVLGWLPLISLMVFIIAYSSGYSNVPFIIMGEIFPSTYRNLLGSISSSFNLTCTFLVVRCFPELAAAIGLHGVFWFFMSCCVAGIVFVAIFLPETKGKTLEDISRIFESKRERIPGSESLKCDQENLQ